MPASSVGDRVNCTGPIGLRRCVAGVRYINELLMQEAARVMEPIDRPALNIPDALVLRAELPQATHGHRRRRAFEWGRGAEAAQP